MTLGRVPGPVRWGPGRPHPGPAFLLLSRLTHPQHCLSDRPVLGPHGQLHFPRRLPAHPPHHLSGSPEAEGGPASAAAPQHAGAVPCAPLGKQRVLKAAPASLQKGRKGGRQWGPRSKEGRVAWSQCPGLSEQPGHCLQPPRTVHTPPPPRPRSAEGRSPPRALTVLGLVCIVLSSVRVCLHCRYQSGFRACVSVAALHVGGGG